MARISIEKALVSAGVGAIDVVTKKYINNFSVGPLDTKDLVRFGLAAGSYIANYLGYERDYTEVIFYSSMPLVVDSIADLVVNGMPTSQSTAITVTPVQIQPPPSSVPSGLPP